ncbi:MAG: U32 family peptidase [Lachnospiraceae bacterium]|nr:U32 family peptidase [Lachnospiraceae bacterium]
MKAELLAPAGSYESLVAAVAAGADAVYIGGDKFGARAFANNLDQEMMLEAIDYVHLHGRKLYMTVNTLLKERELEEELYDYLLPFYERGLDAVIVQDMGVLTFVRSRFPDLHVHVSTQMSISGAAGAANLEALGVTRVVTARELSLQEICAIHDTCHVEIESFVHGALCYCYSGQCLMSSMLGGRSGNRGRCAQPCRLPYQVSEQGRPLNNAQNQYPLSPKDMCTIEILPELLEAGVYSLKIEGRMKKPEYTAGIVRIYRKYLDLYFADPKHYKVDRRDIQELYDIYNRDGFNQSYYKERNGRDMIAVENRKEADGKKSRNEELFASLRKEYIEKKQQLSIYGWLELELDKPAKLQVVYGEAAFCAEGAVVEAAKNQPMTRERILAQVQKTGNTPFTFAQLEVQMSEDIFVPMQQLNGLRRDALEGLQRAILQKDRRKAPGQEDEEQGKTGSTKGQKKDSQQWGKNTAAGRTTPIFASVETMEQLEILLQEESVAGIYANFSMFLTKEYPQTVVEYIKQCRKKQKEAYLALPYIVRNDDLSPYETDLSDFVKQGLTGFLIRNMETYGVLKGRQLQTYCVLDSNLYTWNHRAADYWCREGVEGDTVPFELNEKELHNRDNTFSDMVVYGYVPLMMSAQCVKKTLDHCTKNSDTLTLKDRYKKEFCVKCDCRFCYNIIYNSVPLFLLKQKEAVRNMHCRRLRLSFTMERGIQVRRILQEWNEGRLLSDKGEYTKGHFQRGVE